VKGRTDLSAPNGRGISARRRHAVLVKDVVHQQLTIDGEVHREAPLIGEHRPAAVERHQNRTDAEKKRV
jgi:hypothetical protein